MSTPIIVTANPQSVFVPTGYTPTINHSDPHFAGMAFAGEMSSVDTVDYDEDVDEEDTLIVVTGEKIKEAQVNIGVVAAIHDAMAPG